MEKELTQEQKEALRFDRHIALTANAGSGKTSVLQQRYVNILINDENNTEPRNVVAITFTREAAAEILIKISQNIENRISNAAHLKEKIQLEKIRSKLNTAPVSTIHSFCSTLLRNFPIESNTTPNFGELTEYEKISINDNSIIQALEEWLNKDNIEKNQKIRNIIFTLGKNNVIDLILFLLSKRERFDWLKNFYVENDIEYFIAKRDNIISANMQKKLIPTLEKLNELTNLLQGRKTGKFLNLNIIDLLADKIKSESTKSVIKIETLNKYFSEIVTVISDNNILKSDFSINLTTLKNVLETEEIGYFNKFLTQFQLIKYYSTSFENNEADKDLFKFANTIIELTTEVIENIEQEKELLSGLDFDDQLIKTNELLNNKYVVEKIRKKIKYLMVDEFQDTNDLQYGIITKIIPELKGKEVNGNVNFYIVGDEKQSIYGFRNADVRVFEKAKKDIADTNKILSGIKINSPNPYPEKDESDNFGNLNLTVTFRLAPVPAAFVNKVCGKLFEKPESEFDVKYSPLVCSNGVENIIKNKLSEEEVNLTEFNSGSVVVLLSDLSKLKNEGQFISEAQSLAYYIKKSAIENKKKWSDYGILGRSRKGFDELISELQKLNIPYILHSGKGFYKAQEVVDVCSILSFLHNPNDNKSIAATLRTPYFQIPDEIIYEISNISGDRSFWLKFKKYCLQISEKEQKNENLNEVEKFCLRAFNILTDLTNRSVRISIPQLIHKILDMCDWYSAISGQSSENQMKANINKLIQIAREFEKKGFKNLFDFVEQVKKTISTDLSESEAVFLSDDNAVNIMTIHASKGLQFDTVCLFNATDSYPGNSSYFINDDFGLTFKMKAKDKQNDIFKDVITPTYLYSQDKLNEAESAETKRLLYVALTRAKQNIIISGSVNSINDIKLKDCFLKMITDSLAHNLILNENIKEITVHDSLKCYYENNFYDLKINYPVNINFDYFESTNSEIGLNVKTKNEPVYLFDEIKSESDDEIFSATKLMTYQSNPDEYLRRYLFGLPSTDDYEYKSVFIKENNDDDDIIGSFAGTLIHSVLEKIMDWLNSDGSINERILNDIIVNVCSDSNKKISIELFNRIISECKSIAETTLIKLYAGLIRDSISEQTLQLVFNNDILRVKTDLLIKNASGEWAIWDWKTNRIDTGKKKEELIKYYELQMKIYTYFLMKLYPEQQNFKARLLFTRLAGTNENNEKWFYDYNWNQGESAKIENEIQKLINEIRNKQF
ncbi:MAG: UvrD-helicase domain-containing protein [Ignavibacteriae bacterium]|nr:UvrD-helicase domain-containing protein [Ignavibacteriota bacterium]